MVAWIKSPAVLVLVVCFVFTMAHVQLLGVLQQLFWLSLHYLQLLHQELLAVS
jgi:hypothetical protein